MNKSSTFVRKIIYLAIAGALLIPLSLVSRPAARGVNNDGAFDPALGDPGGKLAQLRDEYDLSQAKLMEIDPASETMKLASVGLRGVAVNMLWMQAAEHRKKENWDKLRSTLNALVKIQPNFIKVWEYQAHNLSYNISVEFDDYEYRYHWVKEGIKFLSEGIPYNYRNHRITDNLGWFCGQKIGRSDEKTQFRQLFRKDKDFHEAMLLTDKRGIEPDLYDTREYGHDNWKLAYQWYDKSRRLVDKYGEQYLADMMFYRKRPMQLMSQARGLNNDFEANEIIQEIWRDANKEWEQLGEREIRSSTGLPITFSGLSDLDSRLSELRSEMDELVPSDPEGWGSRANMMEALKTSAQLSERQLQVLEIPVDERSEEDSLIAANAEKKLQKKSRGVDLQIAENAAPEKLVEARRLAKQIDDVMQKMQFSESYSDTINYRYWDIRSDTESKDITVDARQALWRAQEMKRASIFDDELQFDSETGERKIVKRGAIGLFEEAFDKWRAVIDQSPADQEELIDGELIDDLMDSSGEYYDMLRVTGREWPAGFIFQDIIDARAAYGESRLPTSQDVADRISGKSDGDPLTRKRLEEEERRKKQEVQAATRKELDKGGEEVGSGLNRLKRDGMVIDADSDDG